MGRETAVYPPQPQDQSASGYGQMQARTHFAPAPQTSAGQPGLLDTAISGEQSAADIMGRAASRLETIGDRIFGQTPQSGQAFATDPQPLGAQSSTLRDAIAQTEAQARRLIEAVARLEAL